MTTWTAQVKAPRPTRAIMLDCHLDRLAKSIHDTASFRLFLRNSCRAMRVFHGVSPFGSAENRLPITEDLP